MPTGNLRTAAEQREIALKDIRASVVKIAQLSDRAESMAKQLNGIGHDLFMANENITDNLAWLTATDAEIEADLRGEGLLKEEAGHRSDPKGLLDLVRRLLPYARNAKSPGPAMSDPWGPPKELIAEAERTIAAIKGTSIVGHPERG